MSKLIIFFGVIILVVASFLIDYDSMPDLVIVPLLVLFFIVAFVSDLIWSNLDKRRIRNAKKKANKYNRQKRKSRGW